MVLWVLALAWALLVAWVLARALIQYGGYENLQAAASSASTPQTTAFGTLTVIVPARNEAHNITRCVASLLAQDYPAERWNLIVIDDGSTDNTSQLVAQQTVDHPRLRLLQSVPLPAGWKGKPHACYQAVAALADVRPKWLCFIDADTQAEPQLLRAAVAAAENRQLDLLSLEPFQVLGSFWERLIIPAGFFVVAFAQDLRRVNNPALPDAVANGQFILIRTDRYDAVDGHRGVRHEISEDTALARHVKNAGGRIAVIGAEKLIRTRMYRGLAELWSGLGKNALQTLGGRGKLLLCAGLGCLIFAASVLLPLVTTWTAVAAPSGWSISGCVLAWLGTLALLGTHLGEAHYFRIPWYFGVLFPLAYLAAAVLGFSALWRTLGGEVVWKGRRYPADVQRLPGAA